MDSQTLLEVCLMENEEEAAKGLAAWGIRMNNPVFGVRGEPLLHAFVREFDGIDASPILVLMKQYGVDAHGLNVDEENAMEILMELRRLRRVEEEEDSEDDVDIFGLVEPWDLYFCVGTPPTRELVEEYVLGGHIGLLSSYLERRPPLAEGLLSLALRSVDMSEMLMLLMEKGGQHATAEVLLEAIQMRSENGVTMLLDGGAIPRSGFSKMWSAHEGLGRAERKMTDRMLAFAMGTHRRCGEASWVACMPTDAMRMVMLEMDTTPDPPSVRSVRSDRFDRLMAVEGLDVSAEDREDYVEGRRTKVDWPKMRLLHLIRESDFYKKKTMMWAEAEAIQKMDRANFCINGPLTALDRLEFLRILYS